MKWISARKHESGKLQAERNLARLDYSEEEKKA
jgi:hypothetical protein